jgi:hypothetical protein
VYLPINNALSRHGHVAAFLDQFGQGKKEQKKEQKSALYNTAKVFALVKLR